MTTIRLSLIGLAAGCLLAACTPSTQPELPDPVPSPSIHPSEPPLPPQCLQQPEPSRLFKHSLDTGSSLDLVAWLQATDEGLKNSEAFLFDLDEQHNLRAELHQSLLDVHLLSDAPGSLSINLSKQDPIQPNCPAMRSQHRLEMEVRPVACLIPMPGITEEFTQTLALNQPLDLAQLFASERDSNSDYYLLNTDQDGDLKARLTDDSLTLIAGSQGQLTLEKRSTFVDASAVYCPEITQVTHRLFLSLGADTGSALPMPIIAYQPSWAFDLNKIEWHKLSKIIYSFALPDVDGSMTISNSHQLAALRQASLGTDTEIWLAIGGWDIGHGGGIDRAWSAIMQDPLLLERFKGDILDAVTQYQLDGIDVDWEWPSSSTQQAEFLQLMQELHAMLNPLGVELSTAVVSRGHNGGFIDSQIFDLVTYINIMAYDDNWPWDSSHSDMAVANAALDYWVGQRQLPKEKAILGVPFYCRDRSNFIAYKDILAQGGNADSDVFQGCHYNGVNTMAHKADLALKRAGGIMFWELSQDVQDERSLLGQIYNRFLAHQSVPGDPESCELAEFQTGVNYQGGDPVRWQGQRYQAKWWTNSPPPGDSWLALGSC